MTLAASSRLRAPGAGKTSTLHLIAAAKPRYKGVAITYNREIARAMQASFPRNIRASTAHSLAWNAVIKDNAELRDRLDDKTRMPAWEYAKRVGITSSLDLGGKSMTPTLQARFVQETLANFCQSADPEITIHHAPEIEVLDDEQDDEYAQAMVDAARKAWRDIKSKRGTLPFKHEHYLKLYQLDEPYIDADFICVDEAQDCNPVIAAIVQSQTHAQRVMVGDANQAINGWNGAVDAMAMFDGRRLQLTQSFRFGPAIADVANLFLTKLDSDLRIRGLEATDSTVGLIENPKAILTRTNAAAVSQAIQAINENRRFSIVGGTDEIRQMAIAASELKEGKRTQYPALALFASWAELKEHVEQDRDGSDLKVFVSLIEGFGAPTVIMACDRSMDAKYADVVISTAHKSKGCEWDSVLIGGDFTQKVDRDGEVIPPSKEDLMLFYPWVTLVCLRLEVRLSPQSPTSAYLDFPQITNRSRNQGGWANIGEDANITGPVAKCQKRDVVRIVQHFCNAMSLTADVSSARAIRTCDAVSISLEVIDSPECLTFRYLQFGFVHPGTQAESSFTNAGESG